MMARNCIVVLLVLLAVVATRAEVKCIFKLIESIGGKEFRYVIQEALQVTSLTLKQQISGTPCTPNHYTYRGPMVIVNGGCRANFDICYERGYTIYKECSSDKFRHTVCPTGGLIKVLTVYRQHSNSGCDEGISYFKDGYNIVVTSGCRATFLVGF